MKHLLIILTLSVLFAISCPTNAENIRIKSNKNKVESSKVQTEIPPTPKLNQQDISSKVGIVDVNKDGIICLRTKNGDLAEGTSIKIITSFFESPQKILSANIEKKLQESCAWEDSEAGENPENTSYYSLSLSSEKIEKSHIGTGIALINPKKTAKSSAKLVSVDLNEDGKDEYFRGCTSSEGLHLTIWTGKPLKGKRIWHSYYYLGYDTEPNCKEKDHEGTDD